MRMKNMAAMAVLAAATLLGACGKNEEAVSADARAEFVAECTAAGTDEAEVTVAQMGAYCECMADPTVAMQTAMADGTMPDAAELEKVQNDSMACMKHLE